MKLEKKFLLVFLEIDSLQSDLEISRKIIEIAKVEFQKEVSKHSSIKTTSSKEIGDHNHAPKPPKKKKSVHNPRADQISEEIAIEQKTKLKKNQKSLYKKIASRTHPDKISSETKEEKERKSNLFEKARQAASENDYYTTCKVAESLGIPLPVPKQEDLQSLFETRNRISNEVNKIRSTYPFVWFLEDNEAKKEVIIRQFINQNIKEKA